MYLQLYMNFCISISLNLFLILIWRLIQFNAKIKKSLYTNISVNQNQNKFTKIYKNKYISQAILKDLPFYLEMLALCAESGMNLYNSLKLITSQAPQSVLRTIFSGIMFEIRTGQSWSYAWHNVADKFKLIELQQLTILLIHAEQFGLTLTPILRTQATQLQKFYYAKLEKQALELPVKILLPLILCIFPCSFIVLAFPIVKQLLLYI